jgi:hypothetical protein
MESFIEIMERSGSLTSAAHPGPRRGLNGYLGAMVAGTKSLAKVEELSERMSQPTRRLLGVRRRLPDTTLRNALCSIEPDEVRKPLHALVRKAHRRKALETNDLPFGVVSLDGKGFSVPSSDDWYTPPGVPPLRVFHPFGCSTPSGVPPLRVFRSGSKRLEAARSGSKRLEAARSGSKRLAQRQTQGEDAALTGIVRTVTPLRVFPRVTATLTSSAAKPIIDVTPIPAHTNEMGVFERALDALCKAYRSGFVPARHLRRGRLLGTQRDAQPFGCSEASRARPRFALLIRPHCRTAHAPARRKTLARLPKSG